MVCGINTNTKSSFLLNKLLDLTKQNTRKGWALYISNIPALQNQFRQFSSVTQSCQTLRPHDRSMPGLPIHHQLPEFTQTHVQRVGDAIQPPHPLLSPSPPVPNPSQHQGLFQWVNSLHQVAKVSELQLQHQYFQWIFRIDFL